MVRMAAVGDNVIDRYPEMDIQYPGGSAANAAVFAARSGARASYIGLIGSDDDGAFILRTLQDEGVDVSRVRTIPGPNSWTDIVLDDDGNRGFTGYEKPAEDLVLTEDDFASLRGVDWVHTGHSSYVEQQLPELAAIAPVCFDFSYKGLDYAAGILPSLEVAAFSREGESVEECVALAEQARSAGAAMCIVTRGAHGALVATSDGVYSRSAEPIQAVDTTGAGDAFQASFVHSLHSGEPVPRALATATAFAARVCLQPGAFGHGIKLLMERRH